MADLIVAIVFGVLLGVMALIILIGKGDKLIAGYNTASPAEKARVHIKRVRGLIGGLMLVIAVVVPIAIVHHTTEVMGLCMAGLMILMVVVLILANTWAIKK